MKSSETSPNICICTRNIPKAKRKEKKKSFLCDKADISKKIMLLHWIDLRNDPHTVLNLAETRCITTRHPCDMDAGMGSSKHQKASQWIPEEIDP